MPPRKRKAIETAPESQPQKRVTRSYNAENAVINAQPTESTTPKSKASRTTSTKAKASTKTKSKATSSTAKQSKKDISDTAEATDSKGKGSKSQSKPPASKSLVSPTMLTITSNLTKSPLQCHSYPSPSPTPSPPLIFTHGAGGSCSAPAVVNFCNGFSTLYPILAFNGSMNLASRVKGFHACIAHIGSDVGRLVLGGRSMGARAAVMAALEVLGDGVEREVRLVLASYPLRGPRDVRDRILLDLPKGVEVLFVIGDRDAMCPLEMLEGVRKKMKAGSRLVVVRGADHGMHVRLKKREGDVGVEAGRVVAEWVGGRTDGDVVYVGGDDG